MAECTKCKRPIRLAECNMRLECYAPGSIHCLIAEAAYRRGLADGVKMAKLKAFPDSLTFSSINWTYVDAALEEATR